VQSDVDNNSPVHTNITILTQQLQSLEALELHNINQRQHTDLRRPRPPPKFPSRPITSQPNRQRQHTTVNQAHLITQSKKFKGVKCWACGHSHNLRDCPTTSEEKKQQIYKQKRDEANNKPQQYKHHEA
jgi:hypothetical protein